MTIDLAETFANASTWHLFFSLPLTGRINCRTVIPSRYTGAWAHIPEIKRQSPKNVVLKTDNEFAEIEGSNGHSFLHIYSKLKEIIFWRNPKLSGEKGTLYSSTFSRVSICTFSLCLHTAGRKINHSPKRLVVLAKLNSEILLLRS